MIIDGKSFDDNYNIYNVINMNIGDEEEADFGYSGIQMEDYIKEDTSKEEEMTNLFFFVVNKCKNIFKEDLH